MPFTAGSKPHGEKPGRRQLVLKRVCGHLSECGGPTADLTLLKETSSLSRLPDPVCRMFDLAYVGVEQRCPDAVCLLPRCNKPHRQPLPPEDVIYNTMIASCRIVIEHRIDQLRWYEPLKQVDRQHRQNHNARVASVAGLANCHIRHRSLKSLS